MKNIKKIADQILKKLKIAATFDDPQKEKDFAEYIDAVVSINVTKQMGGSQYIDPRMIKKRNDLERKYPDFEDAAKNLTEEEWFAYQK